MGTAVSKSERQHTSAPADVAVCYGLAEMAKVHTSFNQVEVQILVFKNTLVKVEVLTKLLYSLKVKKYGLRNVLK